VTRIDVGRTVVAYDSDTRRLEIRSPPEGSNSEPLCTGRVGVRAVDGDAASDPDLAVDASIEPTAFGAVDIAVAVENRSAAPVQVAGIDVVDGGTPFGPADRVFEHGYQSWTPTATLRLDESFPSEEPANRPQMIDLAAPADARTSHAVTALSGDPGRLMLGFLDHDSYLSRFDLRTGTGGTDITAVCPLDGVALAPGERRETATLRVDAGRPVTAALDDLASAIGDRMDARIPESVPTGWCSWYHYFTGVTAADIRTTIDDLDAWGTDLDVLQVDDGYETAFGDWRTLADGFESMRVLCDDVVDAGYTPGLWVAPFYVQADSGLAASHPGWLLTEDGEPVDAGARHGPMYALDTTHPGVIEWLRNTFETIVDEWGVAYLKLDFLYAAALPGDRHADVTRAEAYRRGLSTIRDAVGDVFVLGCGAPGFASVGLVDAMRVGPDTAPYWRREGDAASQPATENAVRNVLNRQFCHRRLWITDPDCQLVRTTTALSDVERESFAVLVALSGGSNLLSDAVAEIDKEGRRLFERTLPPVGGGRVESRAEREFPDRIVCDRPADGGAAVAAFNWTDDPRTVRVDPANYVDRADPDGSGHADPYTWDALATSPRERLSRDTIERTVAPHGCVLVHCTPAPPEPRPTLVGATHLANVASQLTAVGWTDGTLTATLDADAPMELVIATPDGWRPASREESTRITDEPIGSDGVVTVAATPGPNEFRFE
jgi:alpha-galactosidase